MSGSTKSWALCKKQTPVCRRAVSVAPEFAWVGQRCGSFYAEPCWRAWQARKRRGTINVRDPERAKRTGHHHGQPLEQDRHPARATTVPRAWATAGGYARTMRGSRRSATSTNSTRISACCCGETLPDTVRAALVEIQHDLFDLGGELCIPGHAMIADSHLARLDQWLCGLQRDAAAIDGIHSARRIARGVAGACVPDGMPPRRAFDRCAGADRDDQRRAAPLCEAGCRICCSCWPGC